MKSRKEIIKSAAYWLANLQIELYNQLKNYMVKNDLTQNDLAKEFKVSKGHISQILNGDSNFTLKKLFYLSLKIGKIPIIKFIKIENYFDNEKRIIDFFEKIDTQNYELNTQLQEPFKIENFLEHYNFNKIGSSRRVDLINKNRLSQELRQPEFNQQNSVTIH